MTMSEGEFDGGYDAGDMGGSTGGFGGGGDSFTETSSTSWFQRIGNAFKGILIGLLLFVVAFPLLWWNEGRAVTTYRSISEGKGSIVSILPDKVDAANDGKFVHLTGKAVTDETLRDEPFAVEAKALRLQRYAEIYQWEETKETKSQKRVGGGTTETTTYHYNKVWKPHTIDSSSFHDRNHQNLGNLEFPGQTKTANKITVGAFTLSSQLSESINKFETMSATSIGIEKATEPVKKNWKIAGEYFYRGANPDQPAIGDQRIKFSQVPPTDVSFYAQQTGDTFRPFQTKAGDALLRLEVGQHSAAEMLTHAESENNLLTWILRVVGFVIMALGIYLVFNPLVVLADVLPFLGNILSMGIGLFAGLIAAALSLVTIGIAWLYYRPVLGISLLVGAGVLIGIVSYLRRTRGRRPAVAVPQGSREAGKPSQNG
jgi:hypothetical protein